MQTQFLSSMSIVVSAWIGMSLLACGRVEPKYTEDKTSAADSSAASNNSSGDLTTHGTGDDHSSHPSDEECMALHECHVNGEDSEDEQASNADDDSNSNETNNTPVPTTPPANSNIVMFNIAAGTSGASWNSQENAVRAKVGQTLRIVNKDSVTHRLHTNGAPCAHGAPIAPGKSFDCVLTKTFNPEAAAGPLYDHGAGTSAEFWLYVVQ